MRKTWCSLVLVNCLCLLAASHLCAQTASTLHLLDDTLPQSLLVDIDRDGQVVFQSPTVRKPVLPDSVVRWQRLKPITATSCVALLDGSWLSGRINWTSDDSLKLTSDWFEPLELNFDQVRAIIMQPSPSPRYTFDLQSQILLHAGASDKVWQRNGQSIAGIVSAQSIPARSSDQAHRIAWKIKPEKSEGYAPLDDEDLSAIALSPVLRPALSPDNRRPQVIMADTSRLFVQTFHRRDDGRVDLQLDNKIELTTLDVAEEFVLAISEITSHTPSARWLSDLEPARYRLLESDSRVQWPLGRNRDLFGKRLFADELPIEKALVIHSPAQVAYRWDGTNARLLASLSLLPEATAGALAPRPGSAQCQVLIGKNNQLTSLYQSPVLRPGDDNIDISVDVSGAQLIVLLVEASDDDTLGDHVLWRDARVVPIK